MRFNITTRRFIFRRWGIVVAGACLVALPSMGAAADTIRLKPFVAQCDYTFDPIKDIRNTSCLAEALLTNEATSEIYFCSGSIRGDQYVAPSITETAPESVNCTLLGQPYKSRGSYDTELVDDTAKADKTLNKMRGTFTWKNAFWVYSRDSLDLKICARRISGAGPDYRMSCSKKINWIK